MIAGILVRDPISVSEKRALAEISFQEPLTLGHYSVPLCRALGPVG